MQAVSVGELKVQDATLLGGQRRDADLLLRFANRRRKGGLTGFEPSAQPAPEPEEAP